MRLNVDNIDPKIIGLIYEDKARHKHSTLAETLSCLIKRAMEVVDDSTIDNLYPLARSLVPLDGREDIKE